MDLRSARRKASWHPLTALIEYEGAWQDRYFWGLPFISEPPRENGRSVVTTIHHELTHLACARTTRFGWAVGAEASRLLYAFRAAGDLSVSPRAATLIGSLLPLLEGLALFAELDFDERPGDLVLPNPVPLHAQMMRLTWHVPEAGVFWLAREEQLVERGTEDGLLRLLFADTRNPEYAFYFVGYLWIKAAAAAIARRDPRFARPTILLPLLIKLICDHPVIARVWSGEADGRMVADEVLRTILSLDPQALERLHEAMRTPDALDWFELWDIHGFMADPGQAVPFYDREADAFEFVGNEPDELTYTVRAAASIHLPSRTSGHLRNVKVGGDGTILSIERDGEEIEANLPSIARLWNSLFGPAREDRQTASLEHALHQEHLFRHVLKGCIGEQITVAGYWGLTYPTLFGVVAWTGSGGTLELPFVPEWYASRDNSEVTRRGLSLSIDERLRFAQSLPFSKETAVAERMSTASFLSHLVSEPDHRSKLLSRRLGGILTPLGRRGLADWVAYPIFREGPWHMGEPAAEELHHIFDMPAFSALQLGLSFKDLLPDLSLTQWR